MAVDNNLGAQANSLFEQIKAILLKPAEEWPKIAESETTTREVFLRYVLPLTAIGPVAGLLGGQIFGYGALGFNYRPSLVSALIMAVVTFVLGLINFLVMTLLVDFLSPKFGGEMNNQRAFKLVAYSSTAVWVAGIFGLVPMLSLFGVLGLYSIYLLYCGANPMLSVPKEKAGGFTAVVILCALLLNFVVYGLGQANMRFLGGMGLLGNEQEASGTLTLPGGGSMDAKQLENIANGKVKAVDPAKLQALLPASIGAYQRISLESTAVQALGSNVEGEYRAGDKSFTLKVTDMAGLGALAGIGAAMGVQQSKEDADGYERTATVDGQIQTEAWNRSSSSGKYGTTVANRFMVEASGKAGSVDELKAAVAAIDENALEDLVE